MRATVQLFLNERRTRIFKNTFYLWYWRYIFAIIDRMSRILDNEIMGDEESLNGRRARNIYMNILVKIRSRTSWKSLLRLSSGCWSLSVSSWLGKPPWPLSLPMNWANLKQTSSGSCHWKGRWPGSYPHDLEPKDVLFIDEIHHLPMSVEEVLTAPWKIFTSTLWLALGEKAECPSDLSSFHFDWGVTTRAVCCLVLCALCFGITGHGILWARWFGQRLSSGPPRIFEMEITHGCRRASQSRDSIANRCSNGCAICPDHGRHGLIDDTITDKSLYAVDVDHEGLDYVDQKIQVPAIEMYGGGPIGLGTLSVNIAGIWERPLRHMYEPYLIQRLIMDSGQGAWRPARPMNTCYPTMETRKMLTEA